MLRKASSSGIKTLHEALGLTQDKRVPRGLGAPQERLLASTVPPGLSGACSPTQPTPPAAHEGPAATVGRPYLLLAALSEHPANKSSAPAGPVAGERLLRLWRRAAGMFLTEHRQASGWWGHQELLRYISPELVQKPMIIVIMITFPSRWAARFKTMRDFKEEINNFSLELFENEAQLSSPCSTQNSPRKPSNCWMETNTMALPGPAEEAFPGISEFSCPFLGTPTSKCGYFSWQQSKHWQGFRHEHGRLVKRSGKSLAAFTRGASQPEPRHSSGQVRLGFGFALLKVCPDHVVWALGPSLPNTNKTEVAFPCQWKINVGFSAGPVCGQRQALAAWERGDAWPRGLQEGSGPSLAVVSTDAAITLKKKNTS